MSCPPRFNWSGQMLMALVLASPLSLPTLAAPGDLTLTVLHSNDGESKLLNAGTGALVDYGGAARFATVVKNLKAAANDCANQRGVVLISSGDNFLAGPEFNASLQLPSGARYYDAIALDLMGYDASAIGNHEFDFGPQVAANFISGFTTSTTQFISANLNFSQEPSLAALETAGKIKKSTILNVCGQQVGIVGATTPLLPSISSPGKVFADPNLAPIIQTQVDQLLSQGVNKIILTSHLQSVAEDVNLIAQLRGIDIAIAGGGSDLLGNAGTLLVPGDTIVGAYPKPATDLDGKTVQVITTDGNFKYVGRLVATFNVTGDVVSVDPISGSVRVSGKVGDPDAVQPDPTVQAQVVNPVQISVNALAANIIGTTQVPLNGQRSQVRTRETNLGSLIGDALLSQARLLGPNFNAPRADVALQNGGGIRNDSIINGPNLTELDTFSILPFSNFLAVVPNVSAAQFKEILENTVSRIEFSDGRFAQIAGFKFTYDRRGTAQIVDNAGTVLTPGSRVKEVVLSDGRVVVAAGQVVPGAPSVNIATIDFLARGGDQYPFRALPFTVLGTSYQQALFNYLTTTLGGVVTNSQYPTIPNIGQARSSVIIRGGDFTNDGKADLLWRNNATGENAFWLMDGTTVTGFQFLPITFDLNVQQAATGDFNFDGRADILFRNYVTGANILWLMNGTALSSTASLLSVSDLNWRIEGSGDFNQDGRSDILWRNYASGDNAVWLMNGSTFSVSIPLPSVTDLSWRLQGTGDFNGDGKADLIWRNYTTGQNAVWLMDGVTFVQSVLLSNVTDLDWRIAGSSDYNNDGKPDLLWRNYRTGENAVWLMNGTLEVSYSNLLGVQDLNWFLGGPR